MKRITTLICFCGLVYASSFAQENYISGIHFGVNGAFYSSGVFNEHNYGSTDLYNHRFTPAFSGGLNLSLSVNDIHEFQFEFIYSLQGQNWRDVHEPDPAELSKTLRLQYLKFPFIYKYKMPFDAYDPYSPNHYFIGGVFTARLRSASLKYAVDGTEVTFEEGTAIGNTFDVSPPADMASLFLPLDVGAIVGWGIEYPLSGNLNFSGEIRTEFSVIDQNNLVYRFPSTTKGYRPSFNVLTGIKLGLTYNFYL